MKPTAISIITLVLCFQSLASTAARADWPQFLGEQRNGISSETGLLDGFSSSGPEVVWRVPGGVGMSAVAVQGGQAVTMWNEGADQLLVSLDAKTGNKQWQVVVGSMYKNAMGDGPRATPTIHNGTIYAFTGDGVLTAVEQTTGKKLWQVDTRKKLGIKPSEYGLSSSPLVVGEQVIVHIGGADACVAAFNVKKGKKLWTSQRGAAGYSSPVLLNVDGEPQLVCFIGAGVCGLRPSDGQTLWSYDFATPYDCNTANPIAIDGGVFISAGENHGCVLLNVNKSGDQYSVTERWASVDNKSVMRNEWQTSVLLDGYLYGFDNVGSAGPITHLTCVKADTGETAWQETRFGKGNLILADGKLWITMMSGEIVLVAASPSGYKELGRAKMFGKTRQSLSITDGHGYIRDDAEVLCVKLKK